MTRFACAALLAVLLAGCRGPNKVEGAVNGLGMWPKDSSFDLNQGTTYVWILELDAKQECELSSQKLVVKDSMVLGLEATAAAKDKTVTIGKDLKAWLYYSGDPEEHVESWIAHPTSGTATFEEATTSSASGNFELTFEHGKLAGTFATSFHCEIP